MAHPQNSPRGLLSKNRIESGSQAITSNSTGAIFGASVFVSNQTTFGKLSANSTALILPNSVRIGTKTTYLSSNTTGVRLGSLYISCNSTGNTTT
jgi:predicted alpha/beta superfamily hydrolase